MNLFSIFSRKSSVESVKEAEKKLFNLAQSKVNQKYITGKLREQLKRVVAQKTAKLPAPRFKVGEVVRVVCNRENFCYGWTCLGAPFTIGQDELGEITSVSVDYSLLEEMLVEDYRQTSFQYEWMAAHDRPFNILDADCPHLDQFVDAYAEGIAVGYHYKIKFENPNVQVFWPLDERFLDYPIGIQVA